jgi:hypothetical protein
LKDQQEKDQQEKDHPEKITRPCPFQSDRGYDGSDLGTTEWPLAGGGGRRRRV